METLTTYTCAYCGMTAAGAPYSWSNQPTCSLCNQSFEWEEAIRAENKYRAADGRPLVTEVPAPLRELPADPLADHWRGEEILQLQDEEQQEARRAAAR